MKKVKLTTELREVSYSVCRGIVLFCFSFCFFLIYMRRPGFGPGSTGFFIEYLEASYTTTILPARIVYYLNFSF